MLWDRIRFGRSLREIRIRKDEDFHLLGTINDAARVAHGISHTGGSALCGVDLTTEPDISVPGGAGGAGGAGGDGGAGGNTGAGGGGAGGAGGEDDHDDDGWVTAETGLAAGKMAAANQVGQHHCCVASSVFIISSSLGRGTYGILSSLACRIHDVTEESGTFLACWKVLSTECPVGSPARRRGTSTSFPPFLAVAVYFLGLAARARALWCKRDRTARVMLDRIHFHAMGDAAGTLNAGQRGMGSIRRRRSHAGKMHFPRARSTASIWRPALVEMTRAVSLRQ
jgi:hypothetical protein